MKWHKLILAALLTVMLTTSLLTGCAEEGANVSPTGETPPVDEILASLIDASGGIKTYEATYDMVMTLSGGGQDEDVMSTNYAMTFDVPAKKIFMEVTAESSIGMTKARSYLLGDIIYIKIDQAGPQDEVGIWEKGFLSEEQQEKGWNSFDTASRILLLMDGAVELLGTETIDGIQTYKITATPAAVELLEYLGSSAEEAVEMLSDPYGFQPRGIEVTVWVDTGSYLPVRLETSWTAGNGGGETVQTQVTSIIYRNINQPVNITLPAEAMTAVDVTDKIPPYPTSMSPIEPNYEAKEAELHNVQVAAAAAALIEGKGAVVEYTNEIIPLGGKTGAANDPGIYLVQSTKYAYTITADGLVVIGEIYQVPQPGEGPPAGAYHGQVILTEFTFQGRVYSITGEIILQTPAGTLDATGIVQPLSNVLSEGETYEVYSIRDVDPGTAIAVKRLLVSAEGASDFYFKYVVK